MGLGFWMGAVTPDPHPVELPTSVNVLPALQAFKMARHDTGPMTGEHHQLHCGPLVIISIIYANIQNLLCNFVAPCPHTIRTKFHQNET